MPAASVENIEFSKAEELFWVPPSLIYVWMSAIQSHRKEYLSPWELQAVQPTMLPEARGFSGCGAVSVKTRKVWAQLGWLVTITVKWVKSSCRLHLKHWAPCFTCLGLGLRFPNCKTKRIKLGGHPSVTHVVSLSHVFQTEPFLNCASFFQITILLRYSPHTIKFSLLKLTPQWFLE